MDFNFLILEKLGSSLEEIFLALGKFFSMKTIMMIGLTLTTNLEYLHFK